MTPSSTVPQARHAADIAGWLGLAAAPAFAVMAGIAALDAPGRLLCASGLLPVDGMTAMYLLMSLFHLPPWLKRAGGRS